MTATTGRKILFLGPHGQARMPGTQGVAAGRHVVELDHARCS